jgi:hypothetical protein
MNSIGIGKNPKVVWTILVVLLCSLSVSLGFNIYLFSKMGHENWGHKDETSLPIEGHFSQMWDAFSIRITPDRAVLSVTYDRYFNVSVTALYWAPFQSEPRTFNFKISDEYSKPPTVVDEKNVTVDKTKDELDYQILLNFTVNLIVGGAHLYTVDGDGCWVEFALNIGE